MPAPLDNIALEFRSAVLAGEHALAMQRVAEYAGAAAAHWQMLSEEERAASELPTRARELLSWARGMTIVQRVITAEQLEQLAILEKASRYGAQRAATAVSTIQISV